MKDIIITSCSRTAVGSLGKTLKNVKSEDLGAAVISNEIKNSKLNTEDIDEVIMGQVLTGGQGQNPARQAAMKSGIPKEKPAYIVNQVCGSESDLLHQVFKVSKQGLKDYYCWWPGKYVVGTTCNTFKRWKKTRRCRNS